MVNGLDDDYKAFIITSTKFGGNFTFDNLCTELIFYEPWVLRLHKVTSSITTHQAFAAVTNPILFSLY